VTDEVRTRPKDRRASILAVASAHFYRGGYAGASLDDIARELGITAPAIYRHFPGKDALYTATLEVHLRQLEECVAAASSARDVIHGLAHVGVDHPTLGLLWNADRRRRLVDPDGALQQRLIATADALGALLVGDASSELATLLARLMLAAVSSTGFYESALSVDEQAAQLEQAIAAIAAFRPTGDLVSLPVANVVQATRPWTTRRSALLDACAVLVLKQGGYHAVTIEQIAAAAGVTPPTVYQLFESKADLLAGVLTRAANWAIAAIQQASTQANSAHEALDLAVASSLELSARHPSWTGSLSDEISHLPPSQQIIVVGIAADYLAEWVAICSAVAPRLPTAAVVVRMRAALGVLDDRVLEAAERSVLSSDDMSRLTREMFTRS
jgi:AcrR family transcriptional regulator